MGIIRQARGEHAYLGVGNVTRIADQHGGFARARRTN